jgi:hypothetical protein
VQQREQNGSGGSIRGSNMGAAAAQEGAKEGAKWVRRQPKREQNGCGGGSSMGSRGERIAGLLGLGSVFLEVFHCGGAFYSCAVYRELVLLYDIYIWHSCVLVTCWL